MVARRVLKWPNPDLLKSASPIQVFDEHIISLAKDLNDTMRVNFGAGLAATQVGIDAAAFVVTKKYAPSFPEDPSLKDAIFVANPKICALTKEMFRWEEACLSVEGVQSYVSRFKEIFLTYQNTEGKLIEIQINDEESATIQHESDHLDGKLFIHRLQSVSKNMVFRKLKKIERKKRAKLKADRAVEEVRKIRSRKKKKNK